MKFINNERFRYIEDTILQYKTNGDIENFIFKMRVYRDNKFNHYIVYFDLLFDKYVDISVSLFLNASFSG